MYKDIEEMDSDILWKIGQRIQEKRILQGISGADMAAYLGVGRNQLSRIENGRTNCTVPHLYILSQLLGCSTDYLLFGKEEMKALSSKQKAALKALIASFSEK